MEECRQRVRDLPAPAGLLFLEPPSLSVPRQATSESPAGVNFGRYALDPAQTANKSFLSHELWLVSALESLDAIESGSLDGVRVARKEAVVEIQTALTSFETMKAKEWARLEDMQSRARQFMESKVVDVVDTGMMR